MTATIPPRLRHVAAVNPPTAEFDHLGGEDEVSFVPLDRVWPRGLDASELRQKSTVHVGYTRFQDGDIVVPKITPTFQADRATIARGLHGGVGAGTTELHVVRCTSDVETRYVRYLLSSRPFLAGGEAVMIGVAGQKRVPDAWLRDFRVPVTRPAEQRRVADYLDAETARIDALIDTKQQMIDCTVEWYRSLVSEVVSTGSDVAVRRVIGLRTSGPRGWADRVTDSGSPFVRSQNLRRDSINLDSSRLARVDAPDTEESRRSRVQRGDVLVGITGANTGWVGVATEAEHGGYVSQHVAILRPTAVRSEWLAFSVFSSQGQAQLFADQYGGTKQQLGLDDLAALRMHVPPADSQDALLETLSATRRSSDELTMTLTRQVELLRERRQSLITAAVTGEMEVP